MTYYKNGYLPDVAYLQTRVSIWKYFKRSNR